MEYIVMRLNGQKVWEEIGRFPNRVQAAEVIDGAVADGKDPEDYRIQAVKRRGRR